MIDYSDLYASLAGTPLEPWLDDLPKRIERFFEGSPHGDLRKWEAAVEKLPVGGLGPARLNIPCVGTSETLEPEPKAAVEAALRELHPWRKGPYCLGGIHIDTEWRSDWKWDRLADHIQPLADRLVLDVGCGNGYHCWRMAGAGARLVLGVDPTLLYVMQFQAIKRLLGDFPVHLLPLAGEDVPGLRAFDTVFSMGVLYHRRSPFDHLLELKSCLQEGGELVLETLVVDGGGGEVLVPEGRYAQMRNVWFLPSVPTLESWLRRSGFRNVRVVDVNVTSLDEQRSTDWMRFQSLEDFLDPNDRSVTVEGLPAPRRAVFLATAP